MVATLEGFDVNNESVREDVDFERSEGSVERRLRRDVTPCTAYEGREKCEGEEVEECECSEAVVDDIGLTNISKSCMSADSFFAVPCSYRE